MKKILITMVALIGGFVTSFAQTSFIATLQHEGEFKHYYGGGALTSAYNDATEGDIITLSPGTFSFSGVFNKGITLRGAGVESVDKTYISSNIIFCSTDNSRVTTVEGIRFSGTISIENNASGTGQGTLKFIKNIINKLNATVANTYSQDKGPIVRLYNNAIYSLYFSSNTHPDFLFYNCYVCEPYCASSGFSETTTAFVNCVIKWANWQGYSYNYRSYAEYAYYLNFYNCIFNRVTSGTNNYPNESSLPITATAYNCLTINGERLFSNIVSGGSNIKLGSTSDVFKTYRDSHNEGETFELTETAKKEYLGTDGTQIGMQGGKYPYTTTVQYPIITKFSSESQTTKDGKLTIDVEVDGK